MKITTFDPIIVSPKAEDLIAVFEALGFEKSHAPVTATSIGDQFVRNIPVKDFISGTPKFVKDVAGDVVKYGFKDRHEYVTALREGKIYNKENKYVND